MNMRSVFIALFFVVLVACDNIGDDRNTSTSEYISQTPALLRNIPAANLTARVSIDNETTTYLGENYPDGNWTITVEVTPNQNYDIFIEWLHLDTLLMEERGSFFTDPGHPVIELDLDFITSGLPQFDNDCDGLSNLEEIMAGSDPEIAESTLQNACNTEPEVPEDPNAIMSPWVGQSFSSIESIGLTDRVTHFSQAIQIKTHSVNLSSSYGFTISTDAQAGPQHQATLRLYHHPTFGKQARLSVTNALSFEASSVTGSDCVPLNTSGLFCTIPYAWKAEHWYELIYEEMSDTRWQAWVIDTESGQKDLIVTLETEPNTQWFRASVGITYKDEFSAMDCTRGLPPTTIHFTGGVANNEFKMKSPQPFMSECIEVGGGWNSSIRVSNGEPKYSLTLGQVE